MHESFNFASVYTQYQTIRTLHCITCLRIFPNFPELFNPGIYQYFKVLPQNGDWKSEYHNRLLFKVFTTNHTLHRNQPMTSQKLPEDSHVRACVCVCVCVSVSLNTALVAKASIFQIPESCYTGSCGTAMIGSAAHHPKITIQSLEQCGHTFMYQMDFIHMNPKLIC